MATHKSLEPVLMAYDRPSPKFLSFLAKHYLLTKSVPQVNNFVVFEGFFLNRSAAHLRKVAVKKPEGEIKPYSLLEREAVRQELGSRPWPFAPADSPRRSVSHLQGPCTYRWDTGYRVPVLKKGCPTELSDHQPVALTSHVVKTLERLVLELMRPQNQLQLNVSKTKEMVLAFQREPPSSHHRGQ
ncbi:alpha-tubulin N-acetyltransferase 1-like [Antennarius striatus]|uniref:alpha-tubulin N-acetyltransferase 1-like n=1 Tax=Antennarius striatus TaxID=241820 RepID=UPI0035B4827A